MICIYVQGESQKKVIERTQDIKYLAISFRKTLAQKVLSVES